MNAEQLTLPPVVHTDDPDTSRPPAETPRRSLMARLLAVVTDKPMTAEEAGIVCGVDTYAAHRRMSDLKNTGQVRDSGLRRPGTSGRLAVVWEAS
jgi:predicted ArsR family transcriptional regulator